MTRDMILLSGERQKVTFIRMLKPDLNIGLYQLQGGRFVVGYTEHGQIYQDEITPEEFGWNED